MTREWQFRSLSFRPIHPIILFFILFETRFLIEAIAVPV
jgi:hypothetical protein